MLMRTRLLRLAQRCAISISGVGNEQFSSLYKYIEGIKGSDYFKNSAHKNYTKHSFVALSHQICRTYKTFSKIDQYTLVPDTRQLKQQFLDLSGDEYREIVHIYNIWLPYLYHTPEFNRLLYTDDALETIYNLVDSECDDDPKLSQQATIITHLHGVRQKLEAILQKKTMVEYEVESDEDSDLDDNEDQQSSEENTSKYKIPKTFYVNQSSHLWSGFGKITTIAAYRKVCEQNLFMSMRYGQPLIIDCGYEHLMAAFSLSSYIRQINLIIQSSSQQADPFHLHFANLKPDSRFHSEELSSKLVTATESDITELFDAKDLIILSPDAPLYLENFDSSKVYVIGGIVDQSTNGSWTLDKAKEHGVECRSLPLDVYERWGTGNSKRMRFDLVVEMLYTLRDTGSWRTVFEKHVPERFSQRNLEQNASFLRKIELTANLKEASRRFRILETSGSGKHMTKNLPRVPINLKKHHRIKY